MTPPHVAGRRIVLGVCGAGAAAVAWRLLGGHGGTSPPDDAAFRSIRRALVDHLDGDVLPFWTSGRINDAAPGGYLPHLDAELRPTGHVERHVIVMLRLLYVHAVALARAGDAEHRRALLARYRRRFDLLRRQYVDDRGSSVFNHPPGGARRRETRSQVHAIYFLTEMFLLAGHAEALDLARSTFTALDAAAHDPVHGGYREPDGIKTLGVHMHLLLALVRLHQARPEPVHLDRIEELTSILVSRFPIPESRGNAYNALTHDWKEIPPAGTDHTRTVYGHTAELIWYVLESARVLRRDVAALGKWASHLASGVLASGVATSGAVYSAGAYRGGAEDLTVWWWAQAEAMLAMLRVFEVTGDARYWETFDRIRGWAFRHLVRDRSGTWVAFTDRWGTQPAPLRAGAHWQSGFHVTRALLQCEETLGRLLARGSPAALAPGGERVARGRG